MEFRPLTDLDFDAAMVLSDQEWGLIHHEFVREFWYSIESPTSPIQLRFYGVFGDDGGLMASGCVADSTANFIMATLSWIIVDQRKRGHGHGRLLVQSLETVARNSMGKTDMLFTTAIPEFYEKMGYRALTKVQSGNTMMHKALV